MFESGQVFHLMIPDDDGERVMHRGVAREVTEGGLTCYFDETFLPMNPGAEVVLFSNHKGKFLQCAATLSAIKEIEGKETYAFTLVGEPMSAETRGSFRLSIVTEEIFAQLNDYPRSRLVDISFEGFGIVMKAKFTPGASFNVQLTSGDETYVGKARIQTMRELENGMYRYGMLAYETASPIRKGLQKLSNDIQRARLKRIARAS